MKRVLSTMLIIALTIPLLVNCKKEKAEEVAIVSLTIEPTSFMLNAGETKQLQVTALPENATKMEKILASLVWQSDNEEIASVDENGLVTAKRYGSVRISASIPDGSVTGSCDITVNQDITEHFDYVFAYALEYRNLIEDSDKIMYDEVTKIKEFTIPATYENQLESCKGLEFLVNLEYLNVSDCKNLKTLDVSKLTKIKSLYAQNCQITDITFWKHGNLEYISLQKNKLKTFNASIFPNLTTLLLSENELAEINLKGCTKLEGLHLNNNKLKSIDLTEATNIDPTRFTYWNNPGDKGVFTMYSSKSTAPVLSWLMTAGDENSRIQGMYYCEKAPKIKTQPQNVSAKDGVQFSLSVELDPVPTNAKYFWCAGAIDYLENEMQRILYSVLPEEFEANVTDENGKYIISGISSPTLTMTFSDKYYKNQDERVKYLVLIVDPDTGTSTLSSPATVTFADNAGS